MCTTFQRKTTCKNLRQHFCNTCSTSASLDSTQLHTCLYPQGNTNASTDPSQNLAKLQYSVTVYLAEVVLVSNTACYKLTTSKCSCESYSCWVPVVRLRSRTYRRVQERGMTENAISQDNTLGSNSLLSYSTTQCDGSVRCLRTADCLILLVYLSY